MDNSIQQYIKICQLLIIKENNQFSVIKLIMLKTLLTSISLGHKSIWGYSQELKMQLTNQALTLLPVEVESPLLIVMPILYISQTNKTKEESFQTEEARWVEPKE
jgi:hypothetical protein